MIGISLVFGLVAAVGMSQVMGSKNTETQPKEQTIEVLVAKEDLSIGAKITPEKVEVRKFPISVTPEGAIKKMEEIEDKVANAPIKKGTYLLVENIVSTNELGAIDIPKGFTVAAINAGKTDTFHDLIKPGNIVDLIGIFRKPGTGEQFARTFMKSIKVFAVNAKMDRSAGDKEQRVSTIQVLVTPKQAEKLALAQMVGQVKLILKADSEAALSEAERNKKVDLDATEGETFSADLFGEGSSSNNIQNFVQQQIQANPIPRATTVNTEQFKMKVISGTGPIEYAWTNRNELPTIVSGEVAQENNTSVLVGEGNSESSSEGSENESENRQDEGSHNDSDES